MHSAILGDPPMAKMIVDHENYNTLDNRRENLRWVTNAQNVWRARRRPGVLGFIGVYESSGTGRRKPFGARIRHDGRVINIGRYETAAEAARAYDSVVTALRGEFAYLNFP